MLRRDAERISILEVVVGTQSMGIEALEMSIRRSLASMDSAF